METNIGRVDQVIRILGGLALIVLFATGVIGSWGLLGLVLLVTGILRFCPIYRLIGIHTCNHGSRLP